MKAVGNKVMVFYHFQVVSISYSLTPIEIIM